MPRSLPALVRRLVTPPATPAITALGQDGRLRPIATWAIVAVVAAVFLRFANHIYPIGDWLLLTLIRIWAWQLLLALACASFGGFAVERLLRVRPGSPLQHLSLSAGLGCLTFGLGMFAAGAVGILSAVWAVLWPVALLATGILGMRGRPPWLALLVRDTPGSAPAGTPSRLVSLATVFGFLCLGVLYLGLLSPEAVSYDGLWTHLVIAQDYAREGRIVPFYADWPKNLAHLGSIINTWAFLVPGLGQAPQVRWMFALHTELLFFLFTLIGVGAAIQRVVDRPIRAAWVWLLLFPGVFVYDGNLGGASDHFAAFFAPPAFLAALEAAGTLDVRWWVAFGALAGGAVATKYQSVYFVAALAVVPATAWLRAQGILAVAAAQMRRTGGGGRLVREGPRHAVRPLLLPLAAGLTATLVVAPHFVRNWLFYNNPVYPFAQWLFSNSTPRFPDSAAMPENVIAHFGAQAPAAWQPRLLEAIRLTFTFPFETHAGYTGALPVFGTLFVLVLPLVLVLRRGRRPWAAIVPALLAVFFWAATYRVDRNLQTIVPLLAVATGAIAARMWEGGRAARAALAVVVALQLVWGADHYFQGIDRITSSLNMIRSGADSKAAQRFDSVHADCVAIGRALPANAKVLLHNEHVNLGIDRPTLMDWLGLQGLIDMRAYQTVSQLYQGYRELGITHIVFHPGYHPTPTKQEEVVFAMFADRYRDSTQTFGSLRLLPLPPSPPPQEAPYTVLVLGVGEYSDGVYPISQLANMTDMPPAMHVRGIPDVATDVGSARFHLPKVDAVLLGDSAKSVRDRDELKQRFHLGTEYPGLSVWLSATRAP